ncbi:hypothetical protein IU433_29695 [Nocardia puris]|nr:hypothetical protein [Nocardia puris]MBF6463178.1 hypothetical protein [Nocardia puris]
MKSTKLALATILTTAALAATTGTSAASPDVGVINFSASATETSSIISIDAGSLVVEDQVVKIKATDGSVVAGMPLSLRIDEFEFPIAAEIAGRTVTMTPQVSLDTAVYKPVALPFEDKAPWKSEYEREQAAWSRMTSTISLGASIATLVGGIGGAAVGCVLGGVLGGTVVGGTIVGLLGPFIPAALAGCAAGAVIAGPLGAVAGQIFITAPVAIAAAVQYFTTINAPFNPPTK